MRSPFRSTAVCAWSVCVLVWILLVFQEYVSIYDVLKASKCTRGLIVLASMAVSVRVSVFRSRFNVLTIQELMARARGKLGQQLW